MDFTLLDTFFTVVHTGNVRKAADLLNSSASALYRRLDQLEKETGITLFENNRSELTPAGKLFYEKTSRMKNIYDQACSDALLIQNAKTTPPVINIATSLMNPALYMMDQLELLTENHPETKLCLKSIPDTISTPEELITIMTENDIHCICIPKDLDHLPSDYGFYQIGYTYLCLAVPPGNDLYGQESVSIHQIHRQSIVTPVNGYHPAYDQIITHLKQGEQNTIIPHDSYVNIHTINACVRNNHLLLCFEKWSSSVPTMKMTKLKERYPFPYGILYRKNLYDR
ncbi:MAG: LysR family transcriptional regulator [Bulleidia sp.]